MTTYRIHSLQHSITINIHIHRPPTLNTSVHHTVSSVSEAQVLFLECHHGVSDGEFNLGQVVRGGGRGVDITLVALVVLCAGNGFVDRIDEGIVHEAECGAGVHDGGVARTVDGLAVDGGGCGLDLPEALAVVDFGVVGLGRAGGGQDVLVDEAEGVETLGLC